MLWDHEPEMDPSFRPSPLRREEGGSVTAGALIEAFVSAGLWEPQLS